MATQVGAPTVPIYLAGELKKVSPKAMGVVVGELSPGVRSEFQKGIGALELPSPTRIHLEVARSAKGIGIGPASKPTLPR